MADRIDDPMLWSWPEFDESNDVQLMTDAQVLAYQRLLACQWRDGDLPTDPRLLALKISNARKHCSVEDLIGSHPEATLEAPLEGSLWGGLKPCFEIDRIAKKIRNLRVEREREEWLAKKRAWSDAGRKGGRASGKTRGKARKPVETKDLEAPLEAPLEAIVDESSSDRQANASLLSLSPPGPFPSLSPPSPGPEDRENQNSPSCRTASDDVETSTGKPNPSTAEMDFTLFWSYLPPKLKTGEAKARKQWCGYPAADRPLDRALAWLKAAKASAQWQKDGGQFAPRGGRIVEEKLYLDGVESFKAVATAPTGLSYSADPYEERRETLLQNGQCIVCQRPNEPPGLWVSDFCLGCDLTHNGPESSDPVACYEGFKAEKAAGQQWVTRVTDASGKVVFG